MIDTILSSDIWASAVPLVVGIVILVKVIYDVRHARDPRHERQAENPYRD